MNDAVANARFAFTILLSTMLNQNLDNIPTSAPYTISHFFTNYPGNLYASMRDGRTLKLTYDTHPDVDNDCFNVVVYFESPLYMSPILQVTMDDQMLGAYKRFVEVFIEVSVSMQEQSGVTADDLNDISFQSILHP